MTYSSCDGANIRSARASLADANFTRGLDDGKEFSGELGEEVKSEQWPQTDGMLEEDQVGTSAAKEWRSSSGTSA